LSYACLLSTKGAYYGANKQASISCIARDRRQDKSKQGKQALARDKRQDKKATYVCLFTFYLTFFADAKQARDRKGEIKKVR
jgi:hypothetical protein